MELSPEYRAAINAQSRIRYWRRRGVTLPDLTLEQREHLRAYRREYMRGWSARNRERVNEQLRVRRAANPQRHRDEVRRYRTINHAACIAREVQKTALRRARLRGAGGTFTQSEWLEKCALLGNVCIYCGAAGQLERDHKIPASRGGSNDISNIVPACHSCNSRKNTKTAAEFLGRS